MAEEKNPENLLKITDFEVRHKALQAVPPLTPNSVSSENVNIFIMGYGGGRNNTIHHVTLRSCMSTLTVSKGRDINVPLSMTQLRV